MAACNYTHASPTVHNLDTQMAHKCTKAMGHTGSHFCVNGISFSMGNAHIIHELDVVEALTYTEEELLF